jgi:IS66 C-terminal element/Transposase IS66 family
VFTLVTARTLRFPPYRGVFLKCFRPFVASWPAPSASGRSESGRVGISPTGLVHLRQGTHNNHIENRIRPVALGRGNWLFAGSLRAGQRAAAVMTLVQSAKLNKLDPYVYLTNVLDRLPTQSASRLEDLLPHRWTPDPTH